MAAFLGGRVKLLASIIQKTECIMMQDVNRMYSTSLSTISTAMKHSDVYILPVVLNSTFNKSKLYQYVPRLVEPSFACEIYICRSSRISEISDKIPLGREIIFPDFQRLVTEISIPSHGKVIEQIDIPGIVNEKRDPPRRKFEKIEASELMRIRRKKMKKHQLRKLRERIWPIMRKVRFLRRRKKERIMQEFHNKIKKRAENFDAMKCIQDKLDIARNMGYAVNIFGNDSQSFGFTTRGVKSEKK